MSLFTNFIALDLEFNLDAEEKTSDIIQIGIAVGNLLHGCSYKKKWYLQPTQSIHPRIVALTGITDQDIEQYAVPLGVAIQEMQELVPLDVDCLTRFITWGDSDVRKLQSTCVEAQVPFHMSRYLDISVFYIMDQILNGKLSFGGLKSALNFYKLKFVGEPHRADDDAMNTLLLFLKMMNKQNNIKNILNSLASIDD